MLTARSIEVGLAADPVEYCFERGWTDGLPVVPPTEDRVLRMLAGTKRAPDETVAWILPRRGRATVERIAINAVMAGCRREYLPFLLAAVEVPAVRMVPAGFVGILHGASAACAGVRIKLLSGSAASDLALA